MPRVARRSGTRAEGPDDGTGHESAHGTTVGPRRGYAAAPSLGGSSGAGSPRGRVIGPERAGNARSRGVDGEWWSRGVYGRASSDGTTNAYSFARNRSSEPALAPSALM